MVYLKNMYTTNFVLHTGEEGNIFPLLSSNNLFLEEIHSAASSSWPTWIEQELPCDIGRQSNLFFAYENYHSYIGSEGALNLIGSSKPNRCILSEKY